MCGCEWNFVCTLCHGDPQHDWRMLLDPPPTPAEELEVLLNLSQPARWEAGTVIRK